MIQKVEIGCDSPVADFTFSPTAPYVNESISFDASGSHYPDGSIESYSWDFGDGTTDFGKTTSHSYSSEGEYEVKLTINCSGGCVEETTRPVNVEPLGVYIVDETVTVSKASGERSYKTVESPIDNINAVRFSFTVEYLYDDSDKNPHNGQVLYGASYESNTDLQSIYSESTGSNNQVVTVDDTKQSVNYNGSDGILKISALGAKVTISPPQ